LQNTKENYLFNKIHVGDEEAFSIFFRKYYNRLYQFAGRYVYDASTAEDIVQNVFINIWKKRKEIKITTNVKSYLYSSVRNSSLNHIKKTKIESTTPVDSIDNILIEDSPGDVFDKKEINTYMQKEIEKLPQQGKQILLMKKIDGLTYHEIADIKNISVNTVKTHISRALNTLSKSLSTFYPS